MGILSSVFFHGFKLGRRPASLDAGSSQVILLPEHMSCVFAWPRVLFNPFKGPFEGRFNVTPSLQGSLQEAAAVSGPFTAQVVSSQSVRIFWVASYEKKSTASL